MDRHIPYDDDGDPVARAAHHGFSPFMIVLAIMIAVAMLWILIRGAS